MKKVLIISYFFPPCNLTAGQRVAGWAKYLKDYNYEPIVITRNWDNPIRKPEDVLKSSGKNISHEKNKQFEVFRIPYKASKRDEIFTRHVDSPFQKISKILTFWNLITENYFIKSIPHANLYYFAREYLKNHPEIKKVIISGNPFNQFYFGYLLEKEFNIKWIADYRDDWNTTELEEPKKGLYSIIRKIQKNSEKKWVKSAQLITSVSPYYVRKITEFVKKNGETILNGYEIEDTYNSSLSQDKFIITYNGSLYPSQPIEPFFNVLKKLILEDNRNIEMRFPGLGYDMVQKKRVEDLTKDISKSIFITDRILKEEVLKIQSESDLLIMISHDNIKGIPSSKLYEYIGLMKPILLFPNDFDIIEETLKTTNQGLICQSEEDIYTQINLLILNKSKNTPLIFDREKIKLFSRKHQTKKLAELLNTL